MPDPTRRTLSATQSPGLFGVSPYVTKWMLWQHFAKGIEIDPPEDGRMSWGKKLQPLIIQQAAEDLKLGVRPNAEDSYHRRGLLGCTRDATIICPDRGPGALETKCVFDYRNWMVDWDGGRRGPQHYEIQLQQQMLVGDGEGGPPYEWGILAAWVAGELKYLERKPIPELWERLKTDADAFFESVKASKEPDPFGAKVEIEWLTKLLPVEIGKVVDLSNDPNAVELSYSARYYKLAKDQESAGAGEAETRRAQILAFAKDAEEVLLPGGLKVRIRPHGKGKRITVFEPETLAPLPKAMDDDILMAG